MKKLFLTLALGVSLFLPFSSSDARSACQDYVEIMEKCSRRGSEVSGDNVLFCNNFAEIVTGKFIEILTARNIDVYEPGVAIFVSEYFKDCRDTCLNPNRFTKNKQKIYNKCQRLLQAVK